MSSFEMQIFDVALLAIGEQTVEEEAPIIHNLYFARTYASRN